MIYAGCWRVQGDLAVSRAFGDAHLKPYGVSSTPELSAISLTPRDAFLVPGARGPELDSTGPLPWVDDVSSSALTTPEAADRQKVMGSLQQFKENTMWLARKSHPDGPWSQGMSPSRQVSALTTPSRRTREPI